MTQCSSEVTVHFDPFVIEHLTVAANSAHQDQMPQNAASDQGLQCLRTECSIVKFQALTKTETRSW